ncbi:MAG: hypothetical protein JSS07_06035 [Proteobacteria bacterium]|nr:hypothetical protein [Pseudomonadota bacterium]
MLDAKVTLKREQDFLNLYNEIQQTLSEYVSINDDAHKNAWQLNAKGFLETLPSFVGDKSLIKLKESLISFSGTLESPTKQVCQTIFGKSITGYLEHAVGAKGSSLKAKLVILAAKYNPLDPEYFIEEIEKNPACILNNQKMNIKDWALISLDAKIFSEMLRHNAELSNQLRQNVMANLDKFNRWCSFRQAYLTAFPCAQNHEIATIVSGIKHCKF